MGGEEYALIMAGGSGARMHSQTPKQFLLLNGRPILMHTLEAFYRYATSLHIVLVLPAAEIDYWHSLGIRYHFAVPHHVVTGGNNRTDSVRKGLEAIDSDKGWVAIHDGVRPLISYKIIAESFGVAKEKGSAVASVRLKDSIRKLEKQGGSQSEDRDRYRLTQTPQTFHLTAIKKAYQQIHADETHFDDASVLEKNGGKIHLIDGDYRNIKITTPEDLLVAEAFLSKENL